MPPASIFFLLAGRYYFRTKFHFSHNEFVSDQSTDIMAHMADNEELLGVRVDGPGNPPDGAMWMVAVAPFGNIVAMNEVSQSELLVFLIFTFFLISATGPCPRQKDCGRGHGGQAGALPRRGEESQKQLCRFF